MKKLLSLLLAAVVCLSVCVVLAACDEKHEHAFKTDWAKDETHHWHECEGEACLEVSDKAEHSWDEGAVTVEATQDAEGEKTYTCTVCGAKKGEPVAFVGISEEKWNAMLELSNFDNYTLTESQNVFYEGAGVDAILQETVFKVAGGKVSAHMTLDGEDSAYFYYTGEEAVQQKNSYEQIYRALLANFGDYKYDEEAKAYVNVNTVTVEIPMAIYQMSATFVMNNAKIKLSNDGKLLEFICDAKQTTVTPEGTVTATFTTNWSFSDYGTTVVTETAQ